MVHYRSLTYPWTLQRSYIIGQDSPWKVNLEQFFAKLFDRIVGHAEHIRAKGDVKVHSNHD